MIPVIGSGGAYSSTDAALAGPGAIVVGRKGSAGSVWWPQTPCWPSDTTFYIEPDVRRVSSSFLFFYLLAHPLSGAHAQTTLPSLQKPDLETLRLPLPPLEEQGRITQILASIQQAKVADEAHRRRFIDLWHAALGQLVDDDQKRAHWAEYAFSDIIDYQEGPGIMARDFRERGVPLVRLAGLISPRSLLEGCNYLDPDAVARRWGHFALQLGDTVLSSSASLGRVSVVGADAVGAIPYTGIIRMRPRDSRVAPEFIRYLLLSRDFQSQAEAAGIGSVMRHFGPSHLKGMHVSVPSIEQQRRIAKNLETIRQAQFRQDNVLAIQGQLFNSALSHFLGSAT